MPVQETSGISRAVQPGLRQVYGAGVCLFLERSEERTDTKCCILKVFRHSLLKTA